MKNPTFPRTNTLTARALMRLVTGQKFTHRDFQDQTASYRLSSNIERLRNHHGWPIVTQEDKAPTSDPTGRTATFGRYLIEPEILLEMQKMLGERLQGFINAVKHFES